MKHIKLALALLALVLAITPVWMKKDEGVVERVKEAMGLGAEHQAYEEGRDAVKGPSTVIGEMKRKAEEMVAAGKAKAEGSYDEATERVDKAAHEAAAQGHSLKERVQDMLHMGKHKAQDATDEASRQARMAADEAAARGHGAFETIEGAAQKARATGEEMAHKARAKGEDAVEYARELKEGVEAKGRAGYEAAKGKVGQAREAAEDTYEGATAKVGETLQAGKRYADEAKQKMAGAAAYGQGVKDELASESKHGLHKEGVVDKVKSAMGFGSPPEPKGVMEEMKEKVEDTIEKAKKKIAEL